MEHDELSQFDGRFEEPVEPATEAPNGDVPAGEDGEQTGVAGSDSTDGAQGNPRSVPYERYEEMAARRREAEARNDELMRYVLSGRSPAPAAEEEPTDPDVERSVAPIIDRKMRGVEELIARQRHSDQLAQLEELSPGAAKMWPEIQAEFRSLPLHLQPDFDGIAGAVALRARIDARAKKPTAEAANALKRRAHTEASPGTNTRGNTAPTGRDIKQMTTAEFARYLEKAAAGPSRETDGYDPLIR